MRTLAFFLIAVSFCFAAGAWIRGMAQDVYDGDTFKLLENGQLIKVRIYGIDAPEANQEYGKESGKALRELIDGKEIRLRIENKDRYGRTVGEPWLEDSINVSLWMIKNGNAWWYKSYSKKRADFEAAEAEAKEKKLGIWEKDSPTPPWDFRSGEKKQKKSPKNKHKKGKNSNRSSK